MKLYNVSIKSHCELPDIDMDFEAYNMIEAKKAAIEMVEMENAGEYVNEICAHAPDDLINLDEESNSVGCTNCERIL